MSAVARELLRTVIAPSVRRSVHDSKHAGFSRGIFFGVDANFEDLKKNP